jgi:ribulose kinase
MHYCCWGLCAQVGATAGGAFVGVSEAMGAMGHLKLVVDGSLPLHDAEAEFHDRKYAVFREMTRHQLQYRAIMTSP